MGFDIGAAALFGGDLFGGAAAAADVGATAAADIAPFATGEDILAAGGADVLGLGGLGDTGAAAALGAGAGDVGAGLGAAGDVAAGLGTTGAAGGDIAAGTAATIPGVDALGGGASFLPDLAGFDTSGLGLGGGGAAVPGADTSALATLTSPAIPPAPLGGGAAAPTIGASQVGDLTTQNLNEALTGSGDVTGAADTGVGKIAPTSGASLGDMLPPTYGAGNVPPTSTASQADVGDGMLAPQADAATYSAPAAGGGGSTAAGAGGGGGDAGGGKGFDWMKALGLGLAAAPLAITLGRGQQNMPAQGTQAQGIDTNVGAAGQQLLQSAVSNTPMPGQQAILTANRQNMINQMRQQLYNSGVQNPEADSRWPAMVANVDNQIAQQTQTFITANLDAALKATGQASGNLTSLAQQQVALDNAYTQAIGNAGQSLGRFVGQAGTNIL